MKTLKHFSLCRMLVTTNLIAMLFPATAWAEQTFPAKISRDERFRLEHLVCGAQFGVRIAEVNAWAFEANAARASFADVRCQPHTQLKGRPLYYVAQCGRDAGQWSCGHAELETIVPLSKRDLVVRPGTVAPLRAVEAIQKISTYGYFQAKSLDTALQSTCNMGMGDAADLIEISCRRWSITVSFWCPQVSAALPCPRVIYMGEH